MTTYDNSITNKKLREKRKIAMKLTKEEIENVFNVRIRGRRETTAKGNYFVIE